MEHKISSDSSATFEINLITVNEIEVEESSDNNPKTWRIVVILPRSKVVRYSVEMNKTTKLLKLKIPEPKKFQRLKPKNFFNTYFFLKGKNRS